MKISADKEHKYFHPDHLYATVYLNEVKQIACVTADEEEGWIIRYKRGENGNFMLDKDDEVVLETVYGNVRVELRYETGTENDR